MKRMPRSRSSSAVDGVNATPPATLPCFAHAATTSLHRVDERRVVAREVEPETERQAEVDGADEHDIDTGRGGDGVDVGHRLDGLDHHDARVRRRLVGARVDPAAQRAERSVAVRRVAHGLGGGVRLLRRRHHRHDDAHRAEVHRPHDQLRIAPPDAHEGTRAAELDRLDERQQVALVPGAVLQVEQHPVDARAPEDLGAGLRRRRRPHPERRPPVGGGLLDHVHRHARTVRSSVAADDADRDVLSFTSGLIGTN